MDHEKRLYKIKWKLLRTIEKISWTEHMIDGEVLEKIGAVQKVCHALGEGV